MELETSLKPLRVASQVMGLNMEGWLGRIYTFMVFIIITSFVYASYIHISKEKIETTEIDDLIRWAQFTVNTLFVSVILIICLRIPRQFLFPIKEMRQIDAVFGYFGVKIKNKNLYLIQSIQIIVCLMVSNLLGARDVHQIIEEKSFVIFFHWLYYTYALLLFMITDCLFIDYLLVINKRYSKLNQLLSAIVESNKFHSTTNHSILYVIEREEIRKRNTRVISDVEKLRLLHHDLCSISKKVNRSFGFQQLTRTATSMVMITGQLYEAYHFLLTDKNPVDVDFQKFLWILFHVVCLFRVSYACSVTSHEASFTSTIIYAIPVGQLSNDLSTQMQHFSLQLIHKNLNFSACGFFDIDFKLICSIVGVVTTYLVILIQMDRTTHCNESNSSIQT